jgi:hypothetical protein
MNLKMPLCAVWCKYQYRTNNAGAFCDTASAFCFACQCAGQSSVVGMKQKLQMTNSGPGDSAADQMVVICSEKQARVRERIYCILS